MALYAIGDTHLSLASDKPMDVFGGGWTGYVDKLKEGFQVISPEDTVVICGDVSWGMRSLRPYCGCSGNTAGHGSLS